MYISLKGYRKLYDENQIYNIFIIKLNVILLHEPYFPIIWLKLEVPNLEQYLGCHINMTCVNVKENVKLR